MSLINDLKRSFLNASKVIVDKTGDYSRMARLSLENKKFEGDIEKKHTEAGKYVFECIQKGDSTIDLKEKRLTDDLEKIKELEEKIKTNKDEIEKLKKSQQPEKTEEKPKDSQSEQIPDKKE